MNQRINDTYKSSKDIAQNVKVGSQSLDIMESNFRNVVKSSEEMTNILSLIRDISD